MTADKTAVSDVTSNADEPKYFRAPEPGDRPQGTFCSAPFLSICVVFCSFICCLLSCQLPSTFPCLKKKQVAETVGTAFILAPIINCLPYIPPPPRNIQFINLNLTSSVRCFRPGRPAVLSKQPRSCRQSSPISLVSCTANESPHKVRRCSSETPTSLISRLV